MNVRKLSVNKACIFLAVLLLAAMVTVSVALYALTQDITAVWYVLLFGIFVLFCSICFMVLVRRKLAMFSDAFCSLMDDMLSGNMQPSGALSCSRNRLLKKKVFSIKLNIG